MAESLSPRLFRALIPARNLGAAQRFYETLLGTAGRLVAPGRVYFDCGPMILGILDYSSANPEEMVAPTEALYFADDDLEVRHRLAQELGCLAKGLLHGDPTNPLGEIVVRPWGERSFYAEDPTGNPLCFVDARTVFTGTSDQVARLSAATGSRRDESGSRT